MKKFNNTQNKAHTTVEGKTVWESRSIAAAVVVLRPNPTDTSILQVLGVKRGYKVNHPGKWCLPCGYLDRDEKVAECALREVYEETGLELEISDLELYEINDDPAKDELQNVTFHYTAFLTKGGDLDKSNCDPGEVEELCWFNVDEAGKHSWAFGHEKRIAALVKN